MGRPQFRTQAERPKDKNLTNQGYDYEERQDIDVPDSFESVASINFPNEDRILESVSIRPVTVGLKVRVGVIIEDPDGNTKAWRYALFPHQVPIQWDPGVLVPKEKDPTVTFFQSSGSSEQIDVYLQHREVE